MADLGWTTTMPHFTVKFGDVNAMEPRVFNINTRVCILLDQICKTAMKETGEYARRRDEALKGAFAEVTDRIEYHQGHPPKEGLEDSEARAAEHAEALAALETTQGLRKAQVRRSGPPVRTVAFDETTQFASRARVREI